MTTSLVDRRRSLSGAEPDTTGFDQAWQQVLRRVESDHLKAMEVPGEPAESRGFPVRPALATLDRSAEPVLRARVETVVDCLNRLIRHYAKDEELQRFMAIPPALHRWILREPDPASLTVDYCRLDLLGDDLGNVRVLECNASSPGGVISSGMINRYWRESALGPVVGEWSPVAAPVEEPDWFAHWLLRYGRERDLPDDDRPIALFHAAVSSRFELDQIRRQFAHCGKSTLTLVPRDAECAKDARLAYLKYIPLAPDEVREWDGFCGRLIDGTLIAPNRLGARWVAESKLCLAALSEPRFRRLFSQEEAACLDTLVPFSRKLGDGIDHASVIGGREHLVLKSPFSFHGRDVHIGADLDPAEWAELVRAPAHQGWLVQERVRPASVHTPQGLFHHDLTVPVLHGHVLGYMARLSRNPVINVAMGGGCYAIFNPHPLSPVP